MTAPVRERFFLTGRFGRQSARARRCAQRVCVRDYSQRHRHGLGSLLAQAKGSYSASSFELLLGYLRAQEQLQDPPRIHLIA